MRIATSATATFSATLLLLVASLSDAFVPGKLPTPAMRPSILLFEAPRGESSDPVASAATKFAGLSAAFWAASTQIAQAAGPDWGIFEGRTGSLLHPVMMGGLSLYSLYTAFLGFQWRRQRTIGDEISELKKQIPDLQGASSVKAAIAAANEAGDAARASQLQASTAVEAQVQELQAERKSLAEAGPRDKHFAQGALLAFLGIAFAIEGPLNTYARAGKLFPGPHLYVGASLVVIWALAFATIPSMQKGNDTARSIHIGANVAGIGLFVWQVVSGIPILFKVIEFTKWP